MDENEYRKLLKTVRHKWHGTGLTKHWGPIRPEDARNQQELKDAVEIYIFEKFTQSPLTEIDILVEDAAAWARNVFENYNLYQRPLGIPHVCPFSHAD